MDNNTTSRKNHWKNYISTKIIRGIRTSEKKVCNLTEGDRLIHNNSELLIFINLVNREGMFLAVSESGKKYWLKGETEIIFVHAIKTEMSIIASSIKKDVLENGYMKFLSWEGIKKLLTYNPKKEFLNSSTILVELEKIETQLPEKYIANPAELLSIGKQELIKALKIKNDTTKSLINNIYDILNGKTLQTNSKNND